MNINAEWVHFEAVKKSYPGAGLILDSFSLDLKKGDFLYVLGDSGVGKSSLLKMIVTEEWPSAGQVRWQGMSLRSLSANQLQAYRQTIGYIPQNIRLIPDFTVLDNILLALKIKSWGLLPASKKPQLQELLEVLGLSSLQHHPAGTLSGGEAQKVAVARALIRSPSLLIADEPTGAQDRKDTWILMDLFLKYHQSGGTVVLATHDRDMVKKFKKKCVLLRQGKIMIEESFCCSSNYL